MTIQNSDAVESHASSSKSASCAKLETLETDFSSSENYLNCDDYGVDKEDSANQINEAGADDGKLLGNDEEKREEHDPKRLTVESIRAATGKIVDDSRFQIFIIVLILINAAMMGIATFDFVTDVENVKNAFEIVDKIFLIIFTIELGLQFVYRGVKLFTDGWLVFDFIIVVMSWSLESLQIVRTFRVFRALRLITRVKVLKNLVGALFSVGPKMLAIMLLLLLIFYIYGVMCTVLFNDLYRDGFTEEDYFSSLGKSLWSLLVMMTLDWANISRQVMKVYSWSWMIFVSFVLITSFIAYNLIIAVVCDSVSIIEQQEEEEEEEDLEEIHSGKIRQLKNRVAELAKQQQQVLHTLQEILNKSNGEKKHMD
mmetsp:Transcript_28203/g.46713  ORF Transcript_28203/g.46713 Transcript_28203/m.46713 type:complete len:369 (+) Transcript_28203:345-1451(+)|eukprot:CAMPEP_0119004756 /NCGR_PEP_ID=MMETSP1176-20130426/1335_1 /TAXON_ID=265551 /ORGANISM="Synedropsis recta cf, Strain CCMP1620" /LENGTH=368 /DNA_ID=CAMNT_0006956501 /DNA_START=256 /DNA_END=1362 /DNA_ORIENTATION=+